MNSILQFNYRQFDAWFTLFICVIIQITCGTFLVPIIYNFFKFLSMLTLYFTSAVFIFLIPIVYLSIRYKPITLSDYIIRKQDLKFLILGVFFIFIILSFIVFSGTYLPFNLYNQTISELPSTQKAIVLVHIFILLPALEEIFFRKYIYEIFRSKYKILVAIFLTVASETTLHIAFGSYRGLILIFLISTFFTVLYIKSKLVISTIVHFLASFSIYFVAWR